LLLAAAIEERVYANSKIAIVAAAAGAIIVRPLMGAIELTGYSNEFIKYCRRRGLARRRQRRGEMKL
jgi:hypothetical protein